MPDPAPNNRKTIRQRIEEFSLRIWERNIRAVTFTRFLAAPSGPGSVSLTAFRIHLLSSGIGLAKWTRWSIRSTGQS